MHLFVVVLSSLFVHPSSSIPPCVPYFSLGDGIISLEETILGPDYSRQKALELKCPHVYAFIIAQEVWLQLPLK